MDLLAPVSTFQMSTAEAGTGATWPRPQVTSLVELGLPFRVPSLGSPECESANCVLDVRVRPPGQKSSSAPKPESPPQAAMQHAAAHLLHRHEHKMPVDNKKKHDKEGWSLPSPTRDLPPIPPSSSPAGNSDKAKQRKLHRSHNSYKALTDMLAAGRKIHHRRVSQACCPCWGAPAWVFTQRLDALPARAA